MYIQLLHVSDVTGINMEKNVPCLAKIVTLIDPSYKYLESKGQMSLEFITNLGTSSQPLM